MNEERRKSGGTDPQNGLKKKKKKKKGHLVWETWRKCSYDRGGDMSTTSQ